MKWKNKFFIGIFYPIFRAFSNWIEMAIIDPKDLSQRIIWIFWTRSTHKCLIWLAKSLNFRRFYVPFSPGFFKNFPRGSGSGLEKNPRGNPGRETPGLTPTFSICFGLSCRLVLLTRKTQKWIEDPTFFHFMINQFVFLEIHSQG